MIYSNQNTRRSWDADNQQTEAARSAYARSQMQMRQWNKELNEFAEMQQRFGKDVPYKTIGAFRRAYRSQEGTLAYAKTHYFRRDAQQYEELKEILGVDALPNTFELFQELKYSKSKVSEFRRLQELRKQNEKVNATPPYNQGIVDSPEYRKKFEDLGLGRAISEVVRESRRCIKINNGTSDERGTFISVQGKSVFTFNGRNSSADYRSMEFSKYPENSLILVHNHPHSGSFSADDILTVSDNPQIKTIIAVGHDGTVYSLELGSGQRVDNSIRREYNELYYESKNADEVISFLSEKYGWRYVKK